MALFLLYAMSQILSAFCLQKKQIVFGECIITEKKRSGFELTAAECSKSALVVRVNEHEFELPTVVQEKRM